MSLGDFGGKDSKDNFNPKRHIREYKRRCNQCGKIWHSLVSRETQMNNSMLCSACIQGTTACGGNLGAATQAQRNVYSQRDLLDQLKHCPECGSADYKEELITYEKK